MFSLADSFKHPPTLQEEEFSKELGGESEVLGVEERSCIAVIIGSNFFLPKLVFGESEVKTNRDENRELVVEDGDL